MQCNIGGDLLNREGDLNNCWFLIERLDTRDRIATYTQYVCIFMCTKNMYLNQFIHEIMNASSYVYRKYLLYLVCTF